MRHARYVLAVICLCAAVSTAWFTIGIDGKWAKAFTYAPTDPPNTPVGVARGIYPGRVVWVHDLNATDWDESLNSQNPVTDPWWSDAHTSQIVVDEMYSKGLRWLTDSTTDEQAWDKLFRHFNQQHGRGSAGYTPGEKIAVKPNHVQQRSLTYADTVLAADQSPQMVLALLKQLVNKAGVPQECITICDSSRYISNKEFLRCYEMFPNVHYLSTNFYDPAGHRADDRYTDPNRPPVEPSETAFVHYSGIGYTGSPIPSTPLPQPFLEATYIVNLGITKGHSDAAITLCGKNWYGCFCSRPGSTDPANSAHNFLPYMTTGMGHYRQMVDLMGHKHLGEKTVLFIQDFLWGFQHHGSTSRPVRFTYPPFNNDYPSSLLMSQDMVAIDSVGHDFLTAQFANSMGGNTTRVWSGVDDYLHEAAQADNPPSGTFYDPENDGLRCASLGVHEHWNNPIEKQYTRNLRTGSGIELIAADPLECTSPPEGDLSGDCRVDFVDLAYTADMETLCLVIRDWLLCGTADEVGCWQ